MVTCRFTVALRAASIESLYEFVRTNPLDFGCRPMVRRLDDGSLETVAFVDEERIGIMREAGHDVTVIAAPGDFNRAAEQTVGTGDRFDGGKRPPRGLG